MELRRPTQDRRRHLVHPCVDYRSDAESGTGPPERRWPPRTRRFAEHHDDAAVEVTWRITLERAE